MSEKRGRPSGTGKARATARQHLAEKIGKRIAERRDARKLNLEDLADLTGISVGQLNRYERGRTMPMPDALQRLAAGLGCKPGWLTYGEG